MTFKSVVLSLLYPLFFCAASPLYAQNPKVGIVLSGGGARGFTHIGVLKVLHDNNIPVDFIGGTSMGALIGGLYALGYTPKELDSLAKVYDWQYLLNDKTPRRKTHPVQRNIDENYFIHLPFNKEKIAVPSGLNNGQEIHHLISELNFPFSHIKDFSQFKIPFLCIATNIENGKQVILDKGYLPDALRASMAIPSYFTPVEINNTLLLDGGLVNNFPVREVKDKGAQFIIGVDVQTSLYEKEELNSLIKIMAQAVFFNSEEKYQENLALCNILIQPDLGALTATSFDKNAVDSLIAIGERAALSQLPQILAALQQDSTKKRNPKIALDTSYYINDIFIEGSNKIKAKTLKSFFKLKKDNRIHLAKINKQIDRLEARGLYESINYELQQNDENEHFLILKVKEKEPGEFNFGVHFDNEMNAAVLANLTLRSLIFRGTSWTTDIRGALQPKIKTALNLEAPIIGGLQIGASYQQLKFNNYFNNVKISDFRYEYLNAYTLVKAKLKNILFLRGGIEFDRAPIATTYAFLAQTQDTLGNPTFALEEVLVDTISTSFNYTLELELDTRNDKYFPSRGWYLKSFYKFINPVVNNQIEFDDNSTSFRADFLTYLPLIHQKWSMGFGAKVAFNSGNVPLHYKMQLGGQMNIEQAQFHEIFGLNRGQINFDAGLQYLTGLQLSTQWQFLRKHYFKAESSMIMYNSDTKIELDWQNGWDRNHPLHGYHGYSLVNYKISYGYQSPVGPLQISIVENRLDKRVWVFLNLGFFL